jgi:ERCC4-type nuclease
MLKVDDRERKVIDTIESKCSDCKIEICRLQTGDYGFYINNKLIWVIERKTWKDFSASIVSNRLSGQLKNFETLTQTDPSIKQFILVEGRKPHYTSYVGSILCESIENKIISIMFEYPHINFIYTKSIEDTARWIQKLINTTYKKVKFPDDETKVNVGGSDNKNKTIDLLATKYNSSQYDDAITALIKIKYMTVNLAKLLLQSMSCREIFATSANIFAELKYTSGRIVGDKYGKKLHYSINTSGLALFYEGIKGVSRNTALMISQLEVKNVTAEQIAELKKEGSGRKVGKKVADKIITILNFKIRT